MNRPRLLDLFCGGGGATRGYQLAGFHVTGVDINPQPHYCGDEFVQADAMAFTLDGFDAAHASPPCQDHSTLASLQPSHGTGWMLAATRERLQAAGLPYVIENVQGASLINPIRLCGSSFGLGVRRHRLFETSPPLPWAAPCAHFLQPEPIDVTGTGGPAARARGQRGGIHRKPRSLAEAREAMGIDWMSRRELSQAVPPAYTEFIGAQLLEHIREAAA